MSELENKLEKLCAEEYFDYREDEYPAEAYMDKILPEEKMGIAMLFRILRNEGVINKDIDIPELLTERKECFISLIESFGYEIGYAEDIIPDSQEDIADAMYGEGYEFLQQAVEENILNDSMEVYIEMLAVITNPRIDNAYRNMDKMSSQEQNRFKILRDALLYPVDAFSAVLESDVMEEMRLSGKWITAFAIYSEQYTFFSSFTDVNIIKYALNMLEMERILRRVEAV